MTSTIIGLASIIAGILVALGMVIRFLTHVYDRGGPAHVLDVARALREVYDPSWPSGLLGYLRRDGSSAPTARTPPPPQP